ncbi:hypothetical protein CLOM_g18440 [Closterium sp. NIES-68]|nr:hypothetical protein CLOM_g18440 [Closterium sp. NIES-68]
MVAPHAYGIPTRTGAAAAATAATAAGGAGEKAGLLLSSSASAPLHSSLSNPLSLAEACSSAPPLLARRSRTCASSQTSDLTQYVASLRAGVAAAAAAASTAVTAAPFAAPNADLAAADTLLSSPLSTPQHSLALLLSVPLPRSIEFWQLPAWGW